MGSTGLLPNKIRKYFNIPPNTLIIVAKMLVTGIYIWFLFKN